MLILRRLMDLSLYLNGLPRVAKSLVSRLHDVALGLACSVADDLWKGLETAASALTERCLNTLA